MLTDAPPRKANRSGFLESDRIRTLDLPQDGRLPAIAKSIESAMKSDESAEVRRACGERLGFCHPVKNLYLNDWCGASFVTG
jgi:hypothetical protein